MNPLSTTENKPVTAACPHCNAPIKFSVFGLLRKTYTCPNCHAASKHGIGFPGPALIAGMIFIPLIFSAAVGFGAPLALKIFGICPCPHCLEPTSRLLIMSPLYTAGTLLSVCIVAALAQRKRTLSQLP